MTARVLIRKLKYGLCVVRHPCLWWRWRRRIRSYRNPDPRCTYPWTQDNCGYCWSYAHHVDGTVRYEDMATICPGCECWTGGAP